MGKILNTVRVFWEGWDRFYMSQSPASVEGAKPHVAKESNPPPARDHIPHEKIGNCLPLSPSVGGSAIQILWIAGVLIVSVCPTSSLAAAAPGAIPDLFQVVTNCPPIANLVFKYRFGKRPTELYELRWQSNAFFARITTNASFEASSVVRDTFCGRWENDYWYYTFVPAPKEGLESPPPVLHKYSFNSDSAYSIAYNAVNRYILTRLRLFTSLGIAGDSAPGDLVFDQMNKAITYQVSRQGGTIIAKLLYSNSLPVQADLKLTTANGGVLNGKARYSYESDIAHGRIPAIIETSSSGSIEVVSLTFADIDQPMTKESFMPPVALLDVRTLQVMVHSNHAEYAYQQGQLVGRREFTQAERNRASQAAENALRTGVAIVDGYQATSQRRYLVLVLFLSASALALFLVFRLIQHKKKG